MALASLPAAAASAQAPSATVVQGTTSVGLQFTSGCFVPPDHVLCVDGVDAPGPSLAIAADQPLEIRVSEPASAVAVTALGAVPAALVDPQTVVVRPERSLAGRRLHVSIRPSTGGDRSFVGTVAAPPARVSFRPEATRHRVGGGIWLVAVATTSGPAKVPAAIIVRGRAVRLRRSASLTAGRAKAFVLRPTAAQARMLRRGMPRDGHRATVTLSGIGSSLTRRCASSAVGTPGVARRGAVTGGPAGAASAGTAGAAGRAWRRCTLRTRRQR